MTLQAKESTTKSNKKRGISVNENAGIDYGINGNGSKEVAPFALPTKSRHTDNSPTGVASVEISTH